MLKDAGNAAFRGGDAAKALEIYSEALEARPPGVEGNSRVRARASLNPPPVLA